MTEVYEVKEKTARETKKDGMQALSVKEERHYTAPLPEAQAPPHNPFPGGLMRALWAGILVGGLLGWLFGELLQSYTLVIHGWEGLFSMGPFTFVFFWAMVGIAAGILTIGISAILATPAPPAAGHDGPGHK